MKHHQLFISNGPSARWIAVRPRITDFRRGLTCGETDDLGYRVASDAVHIHDLQATLLHQLGLDHEHFTYRYQGRDFQLTDVHVKVV